MRILYLNYVHDIHGASFGAALKPRMLFAEMEKLNHVICIDWMGETIHEKEIQNFVSGRKSRFRSMAGYFLREPKSIWFNIKYHKRENQLVERFKPDIIIGRLEYGIFSFVKIAQKFNIPLVVEVDAPPFYEAKHFHPKCIRNPWLVPAIEGYVLKNANHCIMQSQALHDYYLNRYDLDPEKVSWTSNGVDLDQFQLSEKDQTLLKKYSLRDKVVIGFIGSFGAWHGLDNLLKIIETVIKKNPKTCFMIVGSGGADESHFLNALQKKKLSDSVILTGRIDYNEIPRYLNLMDIVLAPYPKHDFFYFSPMKLFEYMAVGKAVLATEVGQIAEIIQDGKNGMFCKMDDAEDVAGKIGSLIEYPDKREIMGDNARNLMEKEYSWKHKAAHWEAVCNKVLHSK